MDRNILSVQILILVVLSFSCEKKQTEPNNNIRITKLTGIPPFITPPEQYFELNIGEIPLIEENQYKLKVGGMIDTPRSFTLSELQALEMHEKVLTIECIGNGPNGNLVGTAYWKGFYVYELLESLGIQDSAMFVKYLCADGYFATNTLNELRNGEVMGALFFNQQPIPANLGFPLRIINPGFYGIRQPGWVVEIELSTKRFQNYYSDQGWKSDSAMHIDSKIFEPYSGKEFALGDSIMIYGAAYGGKRVSDVDITVDGGISWIPVTIVKSLPEDHVWVFWEGYYTPYSLGDLTIHARATSITGFTQPENDTEVLDGTNSWPQVWVNIIERDN